MIKLKFLFEKGAMAWRVTKQCVFLEVVDGYDSRSHTN